MNISEGEHRAIMRANVDEMRRRVGALVDPSTPDGAEAMRWAILALMDYVLDSEPAAPEGS